MEEKHYIFITTQGETTAPNEDYPIDNCQVLGRASGFDEYEALANLYEENDWIQAAGFEKSKIITIRTIHP